MDETEIKAHGKDKLLDGMVFRQAVEADLREMEWEGSYKRYRRVYKDVFQRASSGLALMWVVELPSFGMVGQAFVQLKMRDRSCANGTNRAYIHSFRVRPAFRSRGIGSALMAHIETDLQRRGFQEVTLNVAEDNPGALRLYQRLGYLIIKKIPGRWSFYDDTGKLQHVSEPGYRLMKRLD